MKKKIYVSVALLMFATCVSAQRVYSKEECCAMAVENNVAMKNAHNDVDGAAQEKKSAFTNYFPTVSASGIWYNANEGMVDLMGMSLLKNGTVASLTATQPVFAGGRIINGNKLALVGSDIAKIQLERSEMEVIRNTESYYWQIVMLQEKLKTVAIMETLLERVNRDVETAVNAGIKRRNDLLQVRLRRDDIATTRINIENNLTLSRMVLAQYIGAESKTIEVKIDSIDVPMMLHSGLRQEHGSVVLNTPEYRLLEKNVEVGKLQYRMKVGENLPSVGVGVGYMYDNLMDKDHSFGMVFASVSIPISGWWGGSHDIKKKKIAIRNAENDFEDNSELLVIAMQQAWNDVEDSYKQLVIAYESIEQSNENLRLNEAYYNAGITSMSDLLDAQSLYQQSRDKYVEAYSKYRISMVKYKQATGTLTL